jgi:hypothetical protein
LNIRSPKMLEAAACSEFNSRFVIGDPLMGCNSESSMRNFPLRLVRCFRIYCLDAYADPKIAQGLLHLLHTLPIRAAMPAGY